MGGRKRYSRYLVAFGVTTAVVAGVVGIQLGGATTVTPNPDTIQYVQTTGSNGTYLKYVPGDGSKATTQSVTSGGGCATPSPSGVPILAFSANYYPGGYAGTTVNTAVVGAYKSRTGVCQIPQAWSIEVNEGLVFGVGSNSLVSGRLFSRPGPTRARGQVDFDEPARHRPAGRASRDGNGPYGQLLDCRTERHHHHR